jgi:hypothetical protein
MLIPGAAPVTHAEARPTSRRTPTAQPPHALGAPRRANLMPPCRKPPLRVRKGTLRYALPPASRLWRRGKLITAPIVDYLQEMAPGAFLEARVIRRSGRGRARVRRLPRAG